MAQLANISNFNIFLKPDISCKIIFNCNSYCMWNVSKYTLLYNFVSTLELLINCLATLSPKITPKWLGLTKLFVKSVFKNSPAQLFFA